MNYEKRQGGGGTKKTYKRKFVSVKNMIIISRYIYELLFLHNFVAMKPDSCFSHAQKLVNPAHTPKHTFHSK